MKAHFFLILLAMPCILSTPHLVAQHANGTIHAEFLWSGAWESQHNLVDRFDFKLTVPQTGLALRLGLLDRRPASSAEAFSESFGGDTANKAITQPEVGLYHLTTGSRLLYGVLDTYGLQARIRNVWVRGAPYVQSREESGAELKTAPSSTAVDQGYVHLETNGLSIGQGSIRGFVSLAASSDPDNWAPSINTALNYEIGKSEFALEGYYTERVLPERNSSTWFNEKPALPARNTRLFAGSTSFYMPAFALAADFSYSETFAFGRDYYGSLGLRIGDKPWRFSLALDAAGSRYIDSTGANPGAGFRSAARLERLGKKTGLFRLNAVFRGPGPDGGFVPAFGKGDFAGIVQGINRMSGEVYYRFPTNKDPFGLKRFSLSFDHDERNEKKVLDITSAMAVLKLGPVDWVTEGRITTLNRKKSLDVEGKGLQFDSYRLVQSLSCTVHGTIPKKAKQSNQAKKADVANASTKLSERKKSGKKGAFAVQFSTRAGYEKTINKDGIWSTSFSASLRTGKNRVTVKAATADFPKKWEFTLSWRLLL